jgi:hypothetical protein
MKTRAILVSLLMLLLSATVLWADDDPPGRVARLQYVSGQVSMQPQGTQDWVEATLNRPLTTSDNLWTDKNSRAELSIGTGVLRMNSETSLTFSNLNDHVIQVQLHQGTLSLHLRKLYDGEMYEIDTPNMAFTVQKSGEYRFEVQPEGDVSTVTVYKGKGDATGDGPAVRVEAKEQARFTDGTSMAHSFSPAPQLDGFDEWGIVRNEREDKYASGRYVSPDVIGAGDLDEYGTWTEVPDYGPIWRPTHVAVGWAPYQYGHWVWISPWGWTWVDDAPWGFAPFHYGRWVSYGGYWGWSPGPYYVRPVYAPALVTWFGGRGWGVSIGFGGGPAYGWCPLGYGEPFVPWYHGSRGYFGRVNVSNTRITNITNITNNYYDRPGRWNHYANMRAATAVSERTMLGGRPVHGDMRRVSERDFANAPRDREMGLQPTRESRLGINAGRSAALPPQRSFSRPVMSTNRGPEGGRPGSFGGNRPDAGRIEGGRGPEQHEAQGPSRGGFGSMAPGRNVPRPPDATMRSGADRNSRGTVNEADNRPQRGFGDRGGFSRNSNVPRPPDATLHSGASRNMHTQQEVANPRSGGMGSNERNDSPRSVGRLDVPRPPANSKPMGNEGMNSPRRSDSPTMNSPRSGGMDRGNAPVSRPNPSERSAPSGNNGRSDSPRSFGGPRSMNVPRPTGPVRQASNQNYDYRGSQSNRGYSSADRSGSYINRGGYNQSPRSYGSYDRGGSNQSPRSYGSYDRGNQSPRSYGSYDRGSQPSRSYGSYGGSSQRSYPSSPRYSAPSGGNSGHYSQGSSSHGGGGYSASRSGGGSSSHSNGGGHGRGR